MSLHFRLLAWKVCQSHPCLAVFRNKIQSNVHHWNIFTSRRKILRQNQIECHVFGVWDLLDDSVKLNIRPELETPNNFCPSRFFQVCSDFFFLENANLCRKHVYARFSCQCSNANLYSKSRHTVQICLLEERKIWTHLRRSRRIEIVGGFTSEKVKFGIILS